MHEYAMVEELVQTVVERVAAVPSRVTAVRIRLNPTISVEAFRQAFAMLSHGTSLASAELIIEPAETSTECRCGRTIPLSANHLLGHVAVCPACGTMQPVAHDAWPAVEVVTEDSDDPGPLA